MNRIKDIAIDSMLFFVLIAVFTVPVMVVFNLDPIVFREKNSNIAGVTNVNQKQEVNLVADKSDRIGSVIIDKKRLKISFLKGDKGYFEADLLKTDGQFINPLVINVYNPNKTENFQVGVIASGEKFY